MRDRIALYRRPHGFMMPLVMPVDEKLLEILACPKCKGEVKYVTAPAEGFVCGRCVLFYEVEDDVEEPGLYEYRIDLVDVTGRTQEASRFWIEVGGLQRVLALWPNRPNTPCG